MRVVAFPRKLLNEREEVVLDLRPHWVFLMPSVVAVVVSVVLGLLVIFGLGDGTPRKILGVLVAVAVLGSLGWFGAKYIQWVSTNFVVTGDRVISRRGVFAKSGIEIPLERINTVTFNQRVLERLLGCGDIGIESASDGGRETFSDIRRPAEVQREIYVQMEANNQRSMAHMGNVAAASMAQHVVGGVGGTGGLSVAEQLEKLDELRRNGVLSEAEFQAQKARLLG